MGPRSDERGKRPDECSSALRGIASMGPRSDERGKEVTTLDGARKKIASMGPRSDERGKYPGDHRLRPDNGASMGPRSDERGKWRRPNPPIVKELQPTARAIQSPATNSALFVSLLDRKTHNFLAASVFERLPYFRHHLAARAGLRRLRSGVLQSPGRLVTRGILPPGPLSVWDRFPDSILTEFPPCHRPVADPRTRSPQRLFRDLVKRISSGSVPACQQFLAADDA
jgi:hypothetical protein